MKKLIEILKEINDQIDYEKDIDLVSSGTFSSFDILQCISAIEDNYAIEIPSSEIKNHNFESAKNILEMIERLK